MAMAADGDVKTKTMQRASWMDHEPLRGGFADPSLLALPGLARVRTGIAGHASHPPIHHLFGLRPVSVGPVSASFAVPASPWLCSDAAVFHAGAAALVADAHLQSATDRRR